LKTNDDIIDNILRWEGGFVDNQDDPGGATNWGITLVTFSRWLKRQGSKFELSLLPKEDARLIYKTQYIDLPHFDKIRDWNLRNLVVDCGVNHGRDRTAKWLQIALGGLKVDGFIGPLTLAKLNVSNWDKLYYEILGMRIRFYGQIVLGNPSQLKFLDGWMNRATSFLQKVEGA